MPSTYTHYRMGQEVRKLVGERERGVIEKNPQLFLIGLHGPDILFYYHALFPNEVSGIGFGMHERTGCEFFTSAAEVIRASTDSDAALAYAYGFICHFALDETCHGYIDDKIAASGISHTEIEVEFDRELMIMDGLDPIRQRLTEHIVPSMENASVIRAFFPKTTPLEVQKALRSMISYNNLLVAPSGFKRKLILGLLKITGNYKEMHGLLVNYEKNPLCRDSTEQLLHLYDKARHLAVELIAEYGDFLAEKKPLNPVYRYTFSSKLPE